MAIVKPGYDVEYDFVQPTSLKHTLETKLLKGLFLAGQVGICFSLSLSLSLSLATVIPHCFLIAVYILIALRVTVRVRTRSSEYT